MPTTLSIREQRIKRGWTQEDLARECAAKGAQVTRAAISQIEHGATPRPNLRVVLAELLELDVADFEREAS